jgi:hypothetical protein
MLVQACLLIKLCFQLSDILYTVVNPGNMKIPKRILVLCLFFGPVASGQTDVYNSGQMYISNSTDTVYITGSLNNNAGAALINAGGNIYVLKDLNNGEAGMQAGGGKLWFTGTALQTLTGIQSFRTFNWIVNNPAGVNLQNRIGIGDGVGGRLTFTNGRITSGTQTQDVFFYPNSDYAGFADDKHIIGYCSKSGATDFTFPVGNGALKADLDIFNLSSVTDFQCKYFGTGYGTYTAQSPLVSIFSKEYWTLDRTAGTSMANITLKWNDSRMQLNHTAPADLRVGHFAGGIWINEGGTGSGNTVTGSVSSIAVNNFSPFTFASVGATLPLKIVEFTAKSGSGCQVQISWKSEDEREILSYTIQHSVNGRNWEDVVNLPVRNPMDQIASHSYSDKNNPGGTILYRIRANNSTGGFIYTESRVVTSACGLPDIVVYPTLIRDVVQVRIPQSFAATKVTLVNSTGQLVRCLKEKSSGVINLPMSGYSAGHYTIIVESDLERKSFQVVKIK